MVGVASARVRENDRGGQECGKLELGDVVGHAVISTKVERLPVDLHSIVFDQAST